MGHGASTGSSISSTTINPISIVDAQKTGCVKIVEHASFKDRSEWRRSWQMSKQNRRDTADWEISSNGIKGCLSSLSSTDENFTQDIFTTEKRSGTKEKRETPQKGKNRHNGNEDLLDKYCSDSDYESSNNIKSSLHNLGCEVLPLSDDYFYVGKTEYKIESSHTPNPYQDGKTPHILKKLKKRPSRRVMPNWQPTRASEQESHISSGFISKDTTGTVLQNDVTELVEVTKPVELTESVKVPEVHQKYETESNSESNDFTIAADVHADEEGTHSNKGYQNHESASDNFGSFIAEDKLCSLLCDGGTMCLADVDPSFLLLVDTRKQKEYKTGHIHRGITLNLAELEANNMLTMSLCYKNIVLYDRNGKSHFKSDSLLTKIYQIFWTAGHRPVLLKGGYVSFSRKYPYLCEINRNILSSPTGNSEKLPFYPTSIIDGKFYIGNCEQGSNDGMLHKIGINYVLNLSRINMASDSEGIEVVNFPVEESSKYEGSREVVCLLHKVLHNRGSSILLCCETGTNISGCVAVLVLMYELKWKAALCYNLVQDKRSAISISKVCWKQIKKAEKLLVR